MQRQMRRVALALRPIEPGALERAAISRIGDVAEIVAGHRDKLPQRLEPPLPHQAAELAVVIGKVEERR